MKILFFLGKGGVGKSTVSALTAVNAARNKYRTLLVSFDPAHNTGDIFNQKIGNTPTGILSNLKAIEVNIEYWIKKYLSETEERLKDTYSYQNAFSIKNHFKLLQFSPGVETYALTEAFHHIIKKNTDFHFIIFDMPPTALALQFLTFPQVNMIWLEKLIDLRRSILKKKEIISKIKWKKNTVETDKVAAKLDELYQQNERWKKLFSSRYVHINLVLNPDTLSKAESLLIEKKLYESGMILHYLILNKSEKTNLAEYAKSFRCKNSIAVSSACHSVIGIEGIDKHLEINESEIRQLLK